MIKLIFAAGLAAIAPALPAGAKPAPMAAAFKPNRFSVIVEGQGPDIILIPGLSSPRRVWDASAERLKKTHRVNLVQLKGFGEPAGPNASGPVLQPFVDELVAKQAFDRFRALEMAMPAWASSHPPSAERGARFAASFDPKLAYRPALDPAAAKAMLSACRGEPMRKAGSS